MYDLCRGYLDACVHWLLLLARTWRWDSSNIAWRSPTGHVWAPEEPHRKNNQPFETWLAGLHHSRGLPSLGGCIALHAFQAANGSNEQLLSFVWGTLFWLTFAPITHIHPSPSPSITPKFPGLGQAVRRLQFFQRRLWETHAKSAPRTASQVGFLDASPPTMLVPMDANSIQ